MTKKRFWVKPLIKSRNRAEEFHLLTEELHHGRSWAYFRMSVGVRDTFTDTHLRRQSSNYLSSPSDRQYSAICWLFFFVALCASNATWRWEKQMLWEMNEISVKNRRRDWLVCGAAICSVKSTSIRKVKAPFLPHDVPILCENTLVFPVQVICMNQYCIWCVEGFILAVSPKGLCKQHGWTSFPIPQATWGLNEQISWQIYKNKAPVHHCPARMFCKGWFKTQDKFDLIKP